MQIKLSKPSRIAVIVLLMGEVDPPSPQHLAGLMGVDKRTIYRDIKEAKQSGKLLMQYLAIKGGTPRQRATKNKIRRRFYGDE